MKLRVVLSLATHLLASCTARREHTEIGPDDVEVTVLNATPWRVVMFSEESARVPPIVAAYFFDIRMDPGAEIHADSLDDIESKFEARIGDMDRLTAVFADAESNMNCTDPETQFHRIEELAKTLESDLHLIMPPAVLYAFSPTTLDPSTFKEIDIAQFMDLMRNARHAWVRISDELDYKFEHLESDPEAVRAIIEQMSRGEDTIDLALAQSLLDLKSLPNQDIQRLMALEIAKYYVQKTTDMARAGTDNDVARLRNVFRAVREGTFEPRATVKQPTTDSPAAAGEPKGKRGAKLRGKTGRKKQATKPRPDGGVDLEAVAKDEDRQTCEDFQWFAGMMVDALSNMKEHVVDLERLRSSLDDDFTKHKKDIRLRVDLDVDIDVELPVWPLAIARMEIPSSVIRRMEAGIQTELREAGMTSGGIITLNMIRVGGAGAVSWLAPSVEYRADKPPRIVTKLIDACMEDDLRRPSIVVPCLLPNAYDEDSRCQDIHKLELIPEENDEHFCSKVGLSVTVKADSRHSLGEAKATLHELRMLQRHGIAARTKRRKEEQ